MKTSLLPPLLLLLAALCLTVTPAFGDQPLLITGSVCDVDLPTCVSGVQGLRGARSIAISPDGEHAYIASSLDDALLAFSIDADSGALTLVQSIFDTDAGIDGLNSARGVAVSPDGKTVYVAALLDSSVAAFSRNAMTGLLSFVEVERDGINGVDGINGAHAVVVSPDNAHVYVAGRSEDALAVFSRNTATGALTFLEAHFDNLSGIDGLDAAESVAISPDGKHVYVAGEEDDAVAAFARQTASVSPDFGKLTFVEAELDGGGGVDGLDGAGSVAVSPDGKHVYVGSLRGSLGGIAGDDWAAVFSRNAATGALTFVQGLDELTFGTGTTGIFAFCTGVGNENSGIVVSPNNAFVFLTNPYFGTVAMFARNTTTGVLTLAESICDLSFGLDGIAGAVGITTSPDGEEIYTASPSFETVAVLERAIFADGFESGNTLGWSHAVP